MKLVVIKQGIQNFLLVEQPKKMKCPSAVPVVSREINAMGQMRAFDFPTVSILVPRGSFCPIAWAHLYHKPENVAP
jgi:hypothetical protein